MFKKNISLAVSNPCFEIWLLFHKKRLEDYSEDKIEELKSNRRINNRTALEEELLDVLGCYNKSNINMDCFIDCINNAIDEAERLDVNPSERWPSNIGTRVYLLVRQILF